MTGQEQGSPQERSTEVELLSRLASTLRTVGTHAPGNKTLESSVDRLLSKLTQRWSTQGAVNIAAHSSSLFLDEERLRLQTSDSLVLQYLNHLFSSWGVGSLTLPPGMSREEVYQLLEVLVHGSGGELQTLEQQLSERYLTIVEVYPPPPESKLHDVPPSAARTYGAYLGVAEDIHRAVQNNAQIRTRRLRRVTQTVVDQMLRDQDGLLAMSTIKEFDENLFTHSANVAILSVAIGKRLGLQKNRLGDLCLAAFLHDLGKIMVPKEILDKTEPLQEKEWEDITQHPLNLVHILLNQQHLKQSIMRALIGGFEHHLNYDLSGYPSLYSKSSVTLFGRIITLTDRFDGLTTPRPYRSRNYTPYEAIASAMSQAGKKLDPVLVKLLVDTVGLYPPGTMVGLNTGEIGVVSRPPHHGSPINRPQIRITRGVQPGSLVDLVETDDGNRYLRHIETVMDPDAKGQFPAAHPEDDHWKID